MGNLILECGEFFISFNTGHGLLSRTLMFAQDGAGGETAICRNDRRQYLILNGDWREDYARLAPEGWAACVAFYDSKKDEHRSSWSEDNRFLDDAVTGVH